MSPRAYGHRATGDTRAFVWGFTLSVLLEASELEWYFCGQGNASELGSIRRAPSAEMGRDIPDQAEAGEILSPHSGWFGERHLSRSCITSHRDASSDCSPSANARACRPNVKKASCKFSCKKGRSGISGLNFPLLCRRDLAGRNDFQGLF